MEKIIFPILYISLIIFSLSNNVSAQTSTQDLDHKELMKQFIGNWKGEIGKDTTAIWEVIPFDEGYEHIITYQVKGETYSIEKGFIGFTWEDQTVILVILRPNGMLHSFLGKFVSDRRIIWERYNYNQTVILAYVEMIFEKPDEIKEIVKWKGYKESWDDVEAKERIYTRIKK